MVNVKICGLKDPDVVRQTDEAGADWIGFNFVQGSARAVTVDAAGSLLLHRRRATPVALVADMDDEAIDEIMRLDFPVLQLHGAERPARVAEIKARWGVEVWKAIGVRERSDLDAAAQYGAADRILIDAKPPEGSSLGGGHGAQFDWDILKGWIAPKPWMLAGGLDPENVAAAIAVTGADAVDAASGVERVRGWKTPGLVRAFIAAAKDQ